MIEYNDNDQRIPLELDEVHVDENYDDTFMVSLSFFFPEKHMDEMNECLKEFKDTLYTNKNMYSIGSGQAHLFLCHKEAKCSLDVDSIKSFLVDVFKDDCLALINSKHPDEYLQRWVTFKLRQVREQEISFEDIFGEHPHNLFEE